MGSGSLHLDSLYLYNFRNFPTLRMQPHLGINLIVGGNGAGKTNLLEAIHFLATTRSHRLAQDRYLLRQTEEVFSVQGEISTQDSKRNLRIDYANGHKQALLDGEKTARLSEIVGILTLSIFSPQDLNFIRGAPAERRRLIDMWACQMAHDYLEQLQAYRLALRQRSSLLRAISEGRSAPDQLEVWETELANYGAPLILRRLEIIPRLSSALAESYSLLSAGAERAELEYLPSLDPSPTEKADELAEAMKRELIRLRRRDIALGQTTIGPHRDDIRFLVDGNRADLYASQGQVRLLALSLRLAEYDLLRQEKGEEPLMLLDDVDSELDPPRLEKTLSLLPTMGQVFITTTQEQLAQEIPNPKAVWRMEAGELKPMG